VLLLLLNNNIFVLSILKERSDERKTNKIESSVVLKKDKTAKIISIFKLHISLVQDFEAKNLFC